MKHLNRRNFIGTAATVALSPALLFASRSVGAADMPRVDPEDAQAKALSYTHASPNPETLCSNCRLYTGAADSEWGGCTIFPGKVVAADGWCSAWVKKAG